MGTHKLEAQHPAIRPRRLAVCGGGRLPPKAARFWELMGRVLAYEKGLLVITGGLRHRTGARRKVAADWALVNGLEEELRNQQLTLDGRVETMLPSPDRDHQTARTRFEKGKVIVLTDRNRESRRFCVVNSADVVLSLGGEAGTRTILDMALAIDKPVLPVPFIKGASADVWHDNLGDIKRWFNIPDEEAERLGRVHLPGMTDKKMRELAEAVKDHLLEGFMRKCFVIMPFKQERLPLYNDVIRPLLESMRIMPVRMDQLGLMGNAIDAIKGAITACYGVIADISGNNPNVMYELGMAHAEGKPAIILCQTDSQRDLGDVPFDLRNHQIIRYSSDRRVLKASLRTSLKQMFGIWNHEDTRSGKTGKR
jgi:predicted Rossmann-fold nucleotide-binding protein